MAIHTERLGRLATLLDAYQEQPGNTSFDLASWGEQKTRKGGFLWLKEVECGTSACAVGLACLSGAFKDEGLGAVRYCDGIVPVYGELNEWAAVQAFFGLSRTQAVDLFQDDRYPVSAGPVAAASVAGRIRSLIQRSERSRGPKKRRTTAAVEKIKADALAVNAASPLAHAPTEAAHK